MSYARIASLALTVSCSLPSCLLANELTVSIEDIDCPGVVMLEVFSNRVSIMTREDEPATAENYETFMKQLLPKV